MLRSVLLGSIALALSTPAMASDAPSKTTQDAQDMAEKMNNPAVQSAMVSGLDGMLAALLDMRIDGIAKALEPLNGGKKLKMKGRTVREMAERDDPRFEQKMQGNTRAMASGMGALASALAAAMPQLEAAMDKMDDAMDKAKDRLPGDLR
jgi:TolA-binding protein